MSFTIDGTNGLTFNDATTQASTATNASNISSGTLGKARLPTGSVLQVVNATYSTIVSSSNNTYVDTGLTATITPTSATSKILVSVSQNGLQKSVNLTAYIRVSVLRNSTTIANPSVTAAYNGGTSANYVGSVSGDYLDSPATTSAVVYKTQFRSEGGGATVSVQGDGENSSITLMEIAA
jgi:hypothetical protein